MSASDRLAASLDRSTLLALTVAVASGDGGAVSVTGTGADDPNTGFAVTAAEARPVALAGAERTRGVATGDCT